MIKYAELQIRGPGSGFFTSGSVIRIRVRIWDGKKSWSGSRMNIPDYFSESLETVCGG
jgi:hypothetical protein